MVGDVHFSLKSRSVLRFGGMGYRATRIGFDFFPNPEQHCWYLEGFGDVAWSYSTCTLLDAYLPKVIEGTRGRLYSSELALKNEYLSKIDF